MAYKTTLTTFTVKEGMEAKADEWLRVLIERKAECLETLDREKMHFETIFKSVRDGRLRLTWFDVQSPDGAHVGTSMLAIDKIHVDYWQQCIDREIPPEKFEHVVNFVPFELETMINQRGEI
jgi:hypothetical protein